MKNIQPMCTFTFIYMQHIMHNRSSPLTTHTPPQSTHACLDNKHTHTKTSPRTHRATHLRTASKKAHTQATQLRQRDATPPPYQIHYANTWKTLWRLLTNKHLYCYIDAPAEAARTHLLKVLELACADVFADTLCISLSKLHSLVHAQAYVSRIQNPLSTHVHTTRGC